MLIVMQHGGTPDQVTRVVETIEEMGYQAHPIPGAQLTAVALVGNDGRVDATRLAALSGVREVLHVTPPYQQVSREWRAEPTVVELGGGLRIGGPDVVVMAGPCNECTFLLGQFQQPFRLFGKSLVRQKHIKQYLGIHRGDHRPRASST